MTYKVQIITYIPIELTNVTLVKNISVTNNFQIEKSLIRFMYEALEIFRNAFENIIFMLYETPMNYGSF